MVCRGRGMVEELHTTGVTLGVVDDLGRRAQRFMLEEGDLEGDLMVMYTDGLTEARDPGGTFYGEDRLARVIGDAATTAAQDLVDGIVADLREFTGGPLGDDLGLVVFGPANERST